MAMEIEWNGDEILAQLHGATAEGLVLAVEHLLQVSRTEVPIEETTLERSGATDVDKTELVGVVTYDTPYAVRQHEELTWRHDAGKKAKYLEDPFNQERDTMLGLIAAQARRALRS